MDDWFGFKNGWWVLFEVILKPKHYTSNDLYQAEVSRLFRSCWIFACFTVDIPNDGDFIVKKMPYGEVVLRNAKGVIQAFHNICAHRFSKLFLSECGNSIIECPYHGWRYDTQGKASVVPLKKDCFGAEFQQDKYQLKFLNVSICGKFVFINLSYDNTLNEYLGPKCEHLLNISDKMDQRIEKNRMSIKANWKLVIENSLEDYHLAKVHSNSLAKLLSSKYASSFESNTSTTNIDLLDMNKEKVKKMQIFFQSRHETVGYQHDFIFPNLAIATTNGLSFFIQEAIPESHDKTIYTSHGFLTSFKPSISESIKDHVSEQFRSANRTVFMEDSEICEGIQIALNSPVELPGVLGRREDRIKHFHDLYLKNVIES